MNAERQELFTKATELKMETNKFWSTEKLRKEVEKDKKPNKLVQKRPKEPGQVIPTVLSLSPVIFKNDPDVKNKMGIVLNKFKEI